MELIDRALQSEIIVNTLDVRGLTAPMPAGNQSHSSNAVVRLQYDREEEASQVEVLANLAYSTGGTFFHNNNDLNEGFRRTAETAEYVYVLGFSPQKLDGKFHKLKVRLNTPTKLSIQAREGYYALKTRTNSVKSRQAPATQGYPLEIISIYNYIRQFITVSCDLDHRFDCQTDIASAMLVERAFRGGNGNARKHNHYY